MHLANVQLRGGTTMTVQATDGSEVRYSDGIAAARTMIAVEANAAALQQRLPRGWELAPYAGDDLRGRSLRGANVLVPIHEVYAVDSPDGPAAGLPQVSYVPFISQARNRSTGVLAHVHWLTYTEDPAAVPGRYRDGKLAQITRSQTFTKQRRGETQVRERFSAVTDEGELHLSLAYQQGGFVIWVTADKPNLALLAAQDPSIVRWYQEDQVMNVVRSVPMNVDQVSELDLTIRGELADVFDGRERVVAVVIQRPYMRRVYVNRAHQPAAPVRSVTSKGASMPTETAEVIQRFNDAFERRDPNILVDLVADDCVMESSQPAPNGTRHEGHDACLSFWRNQLADPNGSFEPEDVVVAGERATIRWRYRFGPGHENSVRGVNLMHVRDGKIVEALGYVKAGPRA